MSGKNLPLHLESDCGNPVCKTCEAPVKKKAETGRWYITIGHVGFNSTANNRAGYASERAAIAAYNRYRGHPYADQKALDASRPSEEAQEKRRQIREAIERGLGIAGSASTFHEKAGAVIQSLAQAGYDIVRSRRIS